MGTGYFSDSSNWIQSREILKSYERDKFGKWRRSNSEKRTERKEEDAAAGGDFGTWGVGTADVGRMASLHKHHHHHNQQQQQQRTSLNNVVVINTTLGDTVMQVIAVSAE